MIRIDAVWLAVEPLDMRAGLNTALGRVVKVFGEARAHHAYLFANRRANLMKVLVHDGIGIWLCARRLHQGTFCWSPGSVRNSVCEAGRLVHGGGRRFATNDRRGGQVGGPCY